jgi:hypothetical protein
VPEKLAKNLRQLNPRHSLLLDEIPPDWLMARALQPENFCHLFRGQEAQTPRRIPGLLVAPLGSEDIREILPRERAELPGKLPELRACGALPDDGADETLPGDAA